MELPRQGSDPVRQVLFRLLLVCLIGSASPFLRAQLPGAERMASANRDAAKVTVSVSLDRESWLYGTGEAAHFTVKVTRAGLPLAGAELNYSVGLEMIRVAEQKAVTDANGVFQLAGVTLADPGFVRCTVKLADPALAKGVPAAKATAGFSPEKIQPTQTVPADFDAFWEEGKAALAKVPLDAVKKRVPELCTPTVEVHHVSMRNVGRAASTLMTARVYGMLTEPKAPGKYPAILRVPGAGVRGYGPDIKLAEQGVIVLTIGIHGVPVNLPADVYRDLAAGALANYRVSDLDDRDLIYFRRVYLGCVRANDFLCSQPNFNGKLGVMGSSQGGQLSVVTSVLDPRVQAIAVGMPAYSDVTGFLQGRAGGWPKMFQPLPDGRPNPNATPQKIANTGYYDTVNFARRVQVPGFYTWGFNDSTCPPTTMYSVYNSIAAPKELLLALPEEHHISPPQADAMNAWMLRQLGAGGGR